MATTFTEKQNGDELLANDLEKLLEDAKRGYFHDFESPLATPKKALVERLEKLMDNTKDGRYDN